MRAFTRLNITAEGQTEERFVKDTLALHLGKFNVSTDVRCVLTSKDKRKSHRGGLISYTKAKSDIQMWLKEDNNPEARFTTMFDLYALPNDFPKYEESKKIVDAYDRVEFLENAFALDIQDHRFVPYIQLHEFESLLFSKPEELEIEYFEHAQEIKKLKQILAEKGNPELINDNPETAPSKRIIKLIPEYEGNKVSVGASVVGLIGIDFLKKTCKHFNDWIVKLENL
jgi:hypothetical protein